MAFFNDYILTKDFEHKTFTQTPEPKALVTYLHKHFPNYMCAYEAGYFGFWIYYQLNQMGVNCIVVHPADIPTKDKERHIAVAYSKWFSR